MYKKKKKKKKKCKITTSKKTKILFYFNFNVFKKTLSVKAKYFIFVEETLKKKKKPQKVNKTHTKGRIKYKFSK